MHVQEDACLGNLFLEFYKGALVLARLDALSSKWFAALSQLEPDRSLRSPR